MFTHRLLPKAVALGVTSALVAATFTAASPASAAVNIDPPPIKTVRGGLDGPAGVDADAQGNVYIASQNNNSIVVHAKNANGTSTPLRIIAGPSTGLVSPSDVSFDANGLLYVVNQNGIVLVFPPEASGDVPPLKSFTTGAGKAWGIDVAGTEIYVRKDGGYQVYDSNVSPPVTAKRSVTGVSGISAIKVSNGRVWVADGGVQVRAYATSADGAALPIQVITGALPEISLGIDTDSQGRVHIAEKDGSVRVFASNASGAAAPLKILSGPVSGVEGPGGLAFLPSGDFVVARYNAGPTNNSYVVFSSLFPSKPVVKPAPKQVTKPGKVRSLKVTGKVKAKKRAVRWTAPKSNGGAGITSYRIVIKKGKKTLLVKNVAKNKRAFVVNRSKLRKGVNTVYIQAKNKKGYGPKVKKNFRVKK